MQDAIGEAILEACKAVPDGVLCFLPSYSLLDRLSQRWQASSFGFKSQLMSDNTTALLSFACWQ